MKRKSVLLIIFALMVLGGGGIGYYYWYQGANYVQSEDARIAGDIYRVMPRIAGKITALQVKEGDTVVADQIIGQQDTSNLPTSMLEDSSGKESTLMSTGWPILMRLISVSSIFADT